MPKESSSTPRLTLLDACAVVNLFGTRRMAEALSVIDGVVAVADVVAEESQFVFRGGDGDDAREREPIDLQPLIEAGTLAVLSTESDDEVSTFIDLAVEFSRRGRGGQGEAMTAALAIHRDALVVTDDRKARRILTNRGVPIHSTLELIKIWAERDMISAQELRAVVVDLRRRATYEPSLSHELRGWWESAIV